MKIGVVGAGAIGGFVGSKLRKSGNQVIFLARGQHLHAMQANGLWVKSSDESFRVQGSFTDQYEDLRLCDLVLFTVKSTETSIAAEKLRDVLHKQAYILTLQNGVDNEEVLAEVFGEERILSGASYLSAAIDGPGVIQQSGRHKFLLGAFSRANDPVIEKVSTLFKGSNINCATSTQIMNIKWEKLLWNLTFNPLSAVTGATVGELLDDAKLRHTCEALLQEGLLVSKAMNIEIRQKAIDYIFPSGEMVRSHQTSMLQDREKGKPMEVESLCGYVVKRADEYNINVPVLRTIYATLSYIDVNS